MTTTLEELLRGLPISEYFEGIVARERPAGWAAKMRRSVKSEDWLAFLAELATFHAEAQFWEPWLRLVREMGCPIDDALAKLSDQGLRWLGVAGVFRGGDRNVGMAAYRAFLRSKKTCGPFAGENTQYLMGLLEDGRGAQIEGELALMRDEGSRTSMENLVALAYQARVGTHGLQGLVRVAQDRDRPAEEQALAAYLLHGLAPDRAWAAVIARVLNEKTIWFVFHAQFEPVTQAFGLSVAAKPQSPRAPRGHVAGPPRYMVEADVAPQRGRAARAVDFAPGTWRSPPCAGCAHQMHVWFTLRPAKIPELAWLTWPEAPLFTCGDCVFWTGVNRYKVQPKKKVITLVEAEHTGDKVLAKASANTKLARPQAAKLTKLTRASWEKVEEHHEPTVVAGKPPRLHDDSWPRCRDCKQWMRYYGALGTSPGFNRQGTIANDAGFLLHFACVPCSSITVVPNWS